MGSTLLAPSKPDVPGHSTPPPGNGNDGSGGGGNSGGRGQRGPSNTHLPLGAYRIAIWIAIISIAVLFLALTSVMVARAEEANNWIRTAVPPLLYFNTLVLLTSSFTLEISRGGLKGSRQPNSSCVVRDNGARNRIHRRATYRLA